MSKDYVYGVSRTHVQEDSLLTDADMERLINSENYYDAIHILSEKGYAEGSSIDELIFNRRKDLWSFMSELGIEDELKIFRLSNDFHNLKVAVKTTVLGSSTDGLTLDFGTIPKEDIILFVKNGDYDKLPDEIGTVAKEALDVLLKTRDGQLCDMIIDRAEMEVLLSEAKKCNTDFIENYFRLKISLLNIKVALRCAVTGKSAEFTERAMADGTDIDKIEFSKAAADGLDSLIEVIQRSAFSDCIDYVRLSLADFEKWCDNQLMNLIKPQKTKNFTLSPIVAYLLGVENEIKMVRLILTGKLNSLPQSVILERVREMYG